MFLGEGTIERLEPTHPNPKVSTRKRMIRFSLVSSVVRCSLVVLLPAFVLVLALPALAAGDRDVKSRVAPTYPEMAKRMKISGSVKVSVTVDASGKVLSAKAVSGNRMLEPAAEEAVKNWKFVAAPATTTEEVEINFALAN